MPTQVRITGTYLDAHGRPCRGQVTFIPDRPASAVDMVKVTQAPVVAPLDHAGRMSVLLFASTAQNWADGNPLLYTVTEQVTGATRTRQMALTDDLDLSEHG